MSVSAIELSDGGSSSDWDLTIKDSERKLINETLVQNENNSSQLDELGLPELSSPSSSDDEDLPCLAARLGGQAPFKTQTSTSSRLAQSSRSIEVASGDGNRNTVKSVRPKSSDFYSDSSDVEVQPLESKQPVMLQSDTDSQDITGVSLQSVQSSLGSSKRKYTSGGDSQSSRPGSSRSGSQNSCVTDSSEVRAKDMKKVARMETQQKKEEEKLLKKREREEKKKGEEMEKIRKRALQEAARMYKPTECLKHLTVCLNPDVVQTSAGTGILEVLQHASIKYEVQEQVFPGLITFWREVTQVQEKEDSQEIQQVTNEVVEDTVLMLIPVSEFVQLVSAFKGQRSGATACGETLVDRVMNIEEILEHRKITLICQGVDRYFRMLKDSRKGQKPNSSTLMRLDVEEALVDLQFRCSSNIRLIETDVEVAQLVHCCTKAVANAPFKRNRLQTGFSFHCDSSASVKVGRDGQGLLKAWRQQLQQFRNVTAEVANTIIAKYPSPTSLVQAYNQCSTEKEAEGLLQNLEVRRGAGVMATTRRVGKELSRRVYFLLTSKDASLVLK